jgi:8-oxo-dGTP pyrophosphatase MutT (NUDIX family)
MKPWTTLKYDYVLESPWLNVRRDTIERDGGDVIDPFYVVEYPDWACVLPLTGDGHIIMVEQYRHGIGRFSLELPAGIIDGGESPLDAAIRELREETGLSAREWHPMTTCAPEPSKHTNLAHLFVATDLEHQSDQDLDNTETIRIVNVHAGSIDGLISEGRIVHGIHLYALMLGRYRGLL